MRRGATVTLIEKRAASSNFSRAVGISRASMEILAPSGVSDALKAEAIRLDGVIFHSDSRPLARLSIPEGDRGQVWALAQDRTEHHLTEAFHRLGGTMHMDRPCTGLSQDAKSVKVATPNGPIEADFAIAADGVRSTVRNTLGLEYHGHDLPGEWSIADVNARDWPDPAMLHGYMLSGGNVAVVVPMEKARFRVIASLPDALKALPVHMDVTKVHRAGRFTISIRQTEDYRAGRVLLAGDAAHCHSPVGGRGMNLGIADAAEAAQRIVENDLDEYGESRHLVGKHVIEQSEKRRRMLQATSPLTRSAVETVLRMAGAFEPLGRRLVRGLVAD
ncbi:monooxygenase, FAD-binding protein [Sagittula stellata E-37]|uniref:Monooxygenase, FAD-binding protein n=1 Tax=Sagittula stellata (strain ATCC 700073 / DSM 11524 / E-37) TaxID=388399 RepID=A3K6G4_SAGS3|nr:monooxygenase, FAD-binding protein [Sagittula stellata E-37]